MPKQKPKIKQRARTPAPIRRRMAETDGEYFLKIIAYIVLGSLWLKFAAPLHIGTMTLNGLPLGLFVGLMFASRDRFQIDRKIEYALLVMTAIVTYFLPAGIVI